LIGAWVAYRVIRQRTRLVAADTSEVEDGPRLQ